MSLGYFVMALHPRDSDPARTLEERLGRLGFREVTQDSLETVLTLWQI